MASSSNIRLDTYDRATAALVGNLNVLLSKLFIPVRLESPLDLTPTLLIAILESVRKERLPIPQAVREGKDGNYKVEAMQSFLNVLERDASDADDSFDAIEPQLLAAGEWDAVVLVGHALCRVGHKYGFLSEIKQAPFDSPQVKLRSPTRKRSSNSSADSFWAPRRKRDKGTSFSGLSGGREPQEHNTSRSPSPDYQDPAFSPTLSSTPPMSRISAEHDVSSSLSNRQDTYNSCSQSQRHLSDQSSISSGSRRMTMDPAPSSPTARCIHEVEDASLTVDDEHEDFSVSQRPSPGSTKAQQLCDDFFRPSTSSSPSAKRNAPTIRRSGWIQAIDHDREIKSFESSHSPTPHAASPLFSRYRNLSGSVAGTPPGRVLTRHNSPTQHTLALMNERAKLLEELANIKGSKCR